MQFLSPYFFLSQVKKPIRNECYTCFYILKNVIKTSLINFMPENLQFKFIGYIHRQCVRPVKFAPQQINEITRHLLFHISSKKIQ